jgi:acyl CoA:acetate/3-ketoacid CoA transferase
VGTLTTSGLSVAVDDGRIRIVEEGSLTKFVDEVDEVSFSGAMANRRGQQVRFITERAVFELGDGVVRLIEIAEGLDPDKDIIAHMGFAPEISDDLATMDHRIFTEGAMGLADDFASGT